MLRADGVSGEFDRGAAWSNQSTCHDWRSRIQGAFVNGGNARGPRVGWALMPTTMVYGTKKGVLRTMFPDRQEFLW